jgi:hypothetical protein
MPKSNKVFVNLPPGARALFDQLVERKFYGDKNGEVAKYLIVSALDALVEKGRLIEPPPSANSPSTAAKPSASKRRRQP